jgi:hypothetical protein
MITTIDQTIDDDYKNIPKEEIEGLTLNQMHNVVHNLFGMTCPVFLKDVISDNTLNQIKFFRLCEEFLKIVQRESVLKLTPKSMLQLKVVRELYEHRFIPDYAIETGISKSFSESRITTIHNARIICITAGLIKKSHNSLALTGKGIKLLNFSKRNVLFKLILDTFTNKFNWAYNDLNDDQITGRYGIGYVLILLMKFGNQESECKFYADKYLSAFPNLIRYYENTRWTTPINAFYNCFTVRVFERFLYWFNFVNVSEQIQLWHADKDVISVGEVFHDIFQFEL